jgi:hypothetical protein
MFGPQRQSKFNNKTGLWTVTVTPPTWTHFSASSIRLTEDQHERYQKWLRDGGLIQNMLPELTDEAWEILISGIGPVEWEELDEGE